jgi:two-component system heavy metal sensor histidine kinase CusS
LSVEKAGPELAMRMLDEGGGIPEDQLVRIFNRFERLDKPGESKGNGLGLAICESIVHRHGGRIFARNRNDVAGLVVELRLPEGQSSTS